jgi:hypothetical protein
MNFAEGSDDAARAKGVGKVREEFAGYRSVMRTVKEARART